MRARKENNADILGSDLAKRWLIDFDQRLGRCRLIDVVEDLEGM